MRFPNPASKALHEQFGFQLVGIFRENGRKFGRYWDVAWSERPLRLEGVRAPDSVPLEVLDRAFVGFGFFHG